MGKNYFTENRSERRFNDWTKYPTKEMLDREHELNQPHGDWMIGSSFKQAYEAYEEMKGGF